MIDPVPASSQDFHLQPPQSSPQNSGQAPAQGAAPAPGAVPATPAGTTGTTVADAPIGLAGAAGTMSPQQAVIATAVVLVLAVAFFFVRGGLRSHLIARRASLSAASAAGWSLFALLLAVSVAVAFGVIGDAFRSPVFSVAMAVFVLASAVLCALTWRAALRRRR